MLKGWIFQVKFHWSHVTRLINTTFLSDYLQAVHRTEAWCATSMDKRKDLLIPLGLTSKWSWDPAPINLGSDLSEEVWCLFHLMEVTRVTRLPEVNPADRAALGDGFCSATFNAPERLGKSLDPPLRTHLNPAEGRSGQCKCVSNQPHPIHQHVPHISHDGAATEPASTNVKPHYVSQLWAGLLEITSVPIKTCRKLKATKQSVHSWPCCVRRAQGPICLNQGATAAFQGQIKWVRSPAWLQGWCWADTQVTLDSHWFNQHLAISLLKAGISSARN